MAARSVSAYILVIGSLAATVGAVDVATPGIAGAQNVPSCIVSNLLGDGATVVYPLNDTAGVSAADATGTATLTATITGATYDNRPGPLGCSPTSGALGFDGATTGVLAPPAVNVGTTHSAITVMAWFKSSSFAKVARLVANSETDSTNNGFELEIDNGGASGFFDVGTAGTGISPCNAPPCGASAAWTQQLNLNTWNFYVGTYDGSVVNSYLNGALVGSNQTTGAIKPSTNQVSIGFSTSSVTGAAGSFFNGFIGDVAILPSALSAATIANLYSVGTVSSTVVPATWNGAGCDTVLTASAPIGAFSANVTLKGAGGGGGAANTGSGGSGGDGGQVSGTMPLAWPDTLSALLGCGGGGGDRQGYPTRCAGNNGVGGSGYGAGASSGGACETASIFYDGASKGGGGGGSSALCLATCDTFVATAGGGGGGGGRWDCGPSGGPGAGGGGATGLVGTFSAGANGGTGDDGGGSSGGGGGGQAASGGSGGTGYSGNGAAGSSGASSAEPGGTGGTGRGVWAAASGGGGGGGFTGGGGGGGDGCNSATTGLAVGGGGGSSDVASAYAASVTFSQSGGSGGGTGTGGLGGGIAVGWNVAHVAIAWPGWQRLSAGAISRVAIIAGDSDGLALTYTATGLPSWLSIDAATGVISGTSPSPLPNGWNFYHVKVTAMDALSASATTSTFIYESIGPLSAAPWGCSGLGGLSVYATPGLSLNGSTSTSSTSKALFTVSSISHCVAAKSGAALNGVLPPGTRSITFYNTKNPPVKGRPTTYTYDKFSQFASSQGLASLRKSMKTFDLKIRGQAVPITTSSASVVAGFPCGASEFGIVFKGQVTNSKFKTKYATITICLGGDAGPHTTNNFAADFGSSKAVISKVFFDSSTSSITF